LQFKNSVANGKDASSAAVGRRKEMVRMWRSVAPHSMQWGRCIRRMCIAMLQVPQGRHLWPNAVTDERTSATNVKSLVRYSSPSACRHQYTEYRV